MHRSFRSDIRPSAITPQSVYQRRREVLQLLGLGAIGLATGCHSETPAETPAPSETIAGKKLDVTRKLDTATGETQTKYQDATHYNNYYEFGTGKGDPAANSS